MAQHIDLVLSLDLVIALDGLGVGRGRVGGGPVAAALAGVIRRRRAAARVRGAVVCVSALEGLLARVVWLVRLLLLLPGSHGSFAKGQEAVAGYKVAVVSRSPLSPVP